MDPNQLLNLFGHSINNKDFSKLFTELKIKGKPKIDSFGRARAGSKKMGINFEFLELERFLRNFGKPKSFSPRDKQEMILTEVTFDNSYPESIKKFPFALPYGIEQGDNIEVINKKLGRKPSSKGAGYSYAFAYWFEKDDFRILTALDNSKNLLWLRLIMMDLRERKKKELKKSLTQQNKNISPDKFGALESLKKRKPTSAWKKRKSKGDEIFTDNNIKDTEKVLEDFIDLIIAAAKERKANKVYSVIKKAVTALNKLNDKHESFIDTLEREELVEFIAKATKLTGFKIDDGVDLTEEWREW